MNKQISSGLIMYKIADGKLNVFLVHSGGPFWKGKDKLAWSIPKGEVEEGEELLSAAKREFLEETGIKIGEKEFISLGSVQQKSGKIVNAWAFEGDWNGLLISNHITIEWPPKSGKKIKIPEVDKAGFFSVEEAKEKMIEAQFQLVLRLKEKLKI